ncbi:molybdopterin-binding protein [Methylobacterium dankookense]|uniref:Molybdopterin molybdenumtransferase n=1 Tax=Methylobacterium dankookense TaxID=560405 RepID=A0A564G0H1_9HYPH|nr:molybdopterin-binding protein [Methylobacterium dankookense]GJD56184.1 hypothetical protein IFDJLNFL_2079 [Methylobacterium dankookense]VUF13973.1 Molybdopterin molybdenumtransferase [Methylobacterium dankookense]
MSRSASAALVPLADALALLLAEAAPVAPRAVPPAEAGGLIAAAPVLAGRDRPERRIALRDGYAVEAAAVGGASPYAPVPVVGAPPWLEAGEALPAGSDAVLTPDGFADGAIVEDVAAREGTRGPGEDLAAGDTLLAAGERIGPLHVLALIEAGIGTVEIRQPRLRLVVTGAPGRDGLSPALRGLIAARGGQAEIVAAPDEAGAVAAAIGAAGADAVFVLGGSGLGRTDRSAEALARAGRLLAHGIALRPGESAAIGAAGGRPVLLLPGRPDAALAAFLALGAPLLARLCGAQPGRAAMMPLTRKIASVIGLAEIVFVRSGAAGAEPLGGAELPLRRLIRADGVVLVAPEREGHPAGEQVEVWPL